MNQYKEAEVVMLATKNHTKLYLSKYGVLSQVHKDRNPLRYEQEGYKPQHIYILSSDEIKEGDWMLVPTVNTDYIDYSKCIPLKAKYDYANSKYTKKIIATTDESLYITTFIVKSGGNTGKIIKSFSKPSNSFISKYIEEYNKGNQITKVLVEYEFNQYKFMATLCTTKEKEYNLKVDSNNCITIKKVEPELYTREQVENLLEDAINYGASRGRNLSYSKIIDWIKENL